jgi:hypothetical protein
VWPGRLTDLHTEFKASSKDYQSDEIMQSLIATVSVTIIITLISLVKDYDMNTSVISIK